jgi:hypothetical protein
MTTAVADGPVSVTGVTGVVRLIETGIDVFGATSSAVLPLTPFDP